MALREIRKYQKSTDLLIQKLPFSRIVSLNLLIFYFIRLIMNRFEKLHPKWQQIPTLRIVQIFDGRAQRFLPCRKLQKRTLFISLKTRKVKQLVRFHLLTSFLQKPLCNSRQASNNYDKGYSASAENSWTMGWTRIRIPWFISLNCISCITYHYLYLHPSDFFLLFVIYYVIFPSGSIFLFWRVYCG